MNKLLASLFIMTFLSSTVVASTAHHLSDDSDGKNTRNTLALTQQYDDVYSLWHSSDPRDQDIARPALISVAQNNTHPKQYLACYWLWRSENPDDQGIALTIIRSIRGHDVHLYNSFEFAVCLSGSDDYSSSIIASSIFRSIAQDKTHPNRHAAEKLWHSRI